MSAPTRRCRRPPMGMNRPAEPDRPKGSLDSSLALTPGYAARRACK